MLVLSRQRDETIMIGDNVQVTIVDIRGDKVRIGISAPADIPVHRKEVYESIQRENQAMAEAKGTSPRQVESLAKKHKDEEEAAEKTEEDNTDN